MRSETQLDDLLLAWQEAQAGGGAVDVEALCRDCPELAPALAERIRIMRAMEALAGVAESEGTKAWPTGHVPRPPPRQDTPPPYDTPALGEPGEVGLRPGEQVAGYRIERLLGRGGMGEVYLATDPVLQRTIALKVMNARIADNPTARERFLREARAAAALHDDHIVPVYRADEDAGRLFIAMPLLNGEALQARLDREGRLPVAEALRVARESASGLAAAHRAGLIHRDVKPANLWLEAPTGRVKILDFGLARPEKPDGLTRPGTPLGTPAYMAPEQIDGLPPDARADLFSLGCVLYRMLTGVRAFDGPTLSAVLRAVAACEPVPPCARQPDVPRAASDLVMRLLRRDPTERPGSAAEVVGAVRGLEAAPPAPPEEGQTARIEPAPPRVARTGRRWAWAVAAAVVVGVAAAGLGVGGVFWPRGGAGVPEPLKGSIDVRVWKHDKVGEKPFGAGERLSFLGVLPLAERDWLRIEVELNRPAYVYVVWLESSGRVVPTYPWADEAWGRRLVGERPRQSLAVPPDDETGAPRGAPLAGGPPGVEAILLLARDTPLPPGAERELAHVFATHWQPNRLQDDRAAAWLEDGKLVVGERNRGAIKIGEARDVEDPVLRTQRLLRQELRPWFSYSRAVCYGFKGG